MRAVGRRSRSGVPRGFHPRRGFLGVVVLCAALILAGCASARVNQFKNFSQAGVAYSEAADVVLKEAGVLVIEETSMQLVEFRNEAALSPDQLRQFLDKKDKSDREFLDILADIHRHNTLLRDYFAVLGELAESDAPGQIGESASELYNAAARLHPVIENATILGSPVSGFVEPAVTIIIAEFRRAELDRELKERAGLIERELALQEAVMKALDAGTKARIERLLAARRETYTAPYVDVGKPPRKTVGKAAMRKPLPENWAKQRRDLVTAEVSSRALTQASEAAGKLRSSFAKLVNGELDLADLQLLLQDIDRVLTAFEALRAKEQGQ